MLKRYIAIFLTLIILCGSFCSFADGAGLPGDDVFASAKAALAYMAQKNFSAAIGELNASSWLSASELKQTIDVQLKRLYGANVQTEYAVAWRNGTGVYLAVPVYEPSDGYVDAIIYRLSSDFKFTGFRFAHWGEVEDELSMTAYTKWNIEYSPSYTIFVD